LRAGRADRDLFPSYPAGRPAMNAASRAGTAAARDDPARGRHAEALPTQRAVLAAALTGA
jgi:hypothetical protein